MSGELLYIGDYLGGSFSPCGATYTTAVADAIASHIALKGAEDEVLIAHEIEAYPKPAKGLAQGGGGVSQYAHLFVLIGYVGEEVFDKLLIASSLVKGGVGEDGFHV